MFRLSGLAAALALSLLALSTGVPPTSIVELRKAFEHPPDEARIMMRWWWFGPAVTKSGLDREMRLMKAGGIGGFEVQPVYPLALDNPANGVRNLPYLSPEYLEALKFTSERARELGLRMDLTLGSGWPFGGPHIPITQAAGRLRWERVQVASDSRRVPLPAMTAGEKLLGAFAGRTRRELTDINDGILRLPSTGEQPKEIWFFIASRTGMMVKRAALGSEGFVLDHYDRSALENHLRNVAEPQMRALGANRPYAIFCDSLEVFGSDWSGDFLEEFQKRRRYDLKPHLPDLVADLGPQSTAVRHDWGKTMTELVEERFYVPLLAWTRANGTLFRIQGYGAPPAALSSFALADLAEGEGPRWKELQSARWAASASHIFGKPVSSSETWTWLHSPSFRATPLDMKVEADLHFLQGVNQLIGHGWPYTAEGVEYPGWRFYAAAVFNEANPWWLVMPDVSVYLQRVSFLLRQGKPANDVALYLPNSDAWSHLTRGRVHLLDTLRERLGPNSMARILEAGYGLDVFDDGSLGRAGRIEKDALMLGNNRYRVVVLPGLETIPLATLRKFEEFARAGGILIATRRVPSSAPGVTTPAENAEVQAIVERLFRAPSTARLVADENQLGDALRARLEPDLALTPAHPDIGFVHRSTDFAEIYFLVNTANTPQSFRAKFRVSGLEPEWWDPMTGRVTPAKVLERSSAGSTVTLEFEPYSSRVLVFSRRAPTPATPSQTNTLPAIDLGTGWSVAFGEGGKPAPMDPLKSWIDDESTRYYSGQATYTRDVTIPYSFGRRRVMLDLGEGKPIPATRMTNGMRAWLDAPVREAAVVYVNEQRAGAVWCPPYAVDITTLLKPGANRLRIVVANLALNHMAGRPLPDYRLLNLRYGVRFEAQDMDKVQPVPAGLLGPIRLLASEAGL